MSDWKARIDQWQAQKRDEAEEKQRRAKAEQERREAEQERREYEKRLKDHQKRFHCHICGTASSGPYRYEELDDSIDGTRYLWRTNWDRPHNLDRCSRCGKWACISNPEHIYNGICERCASKLR